MVGTYKLDLRYFKEHHLRGLYKCHIITKAELNDEMDRRMEEAVARVDKYTEKEVVA